MKLSTRQNKDGFTIVELMISLSILSVILVTASAMMVRIGAIYNKGVNQSNTQNTSRDIVADIATSIQFSGDKPAGCKKTYDVIVDFGGTPRSIGTTCAHNRAAFTDPTYGADIDVYAYCVGSTRYSYIIGRPSGYATKRVLWKDKIPPASSCDPVDINSDAAVAATDSGYDMVGTRMGLTKFNINPVAGQNGAYRIEVNLAYGAVDLISVSSTGRPRCSSTIGSQYCATSVAATTVTRRID